MATSAAGEDGRRGGSDCTEQPVSGYPVDHERGHRGRRRDAGQGERPERAAFHAAQAAGQRDQPSRQLSGGVGEQQGRPGNRQPGQAETCGEHASVGDQGGGGARQDGCRPAISGVLAGQPADG